MWLLLKLCLKGWYRFLSEKEFRFFYWLVFKHSGKKRFKSYQTTLYNHPFLVADSLSFVWQYHDIFREGFYHFQTEKKDPLIYDVGSNIGLSVLYFKRLYPNSRIRAFEPDKEIMDILKGNLKFQKLDDGSVEVTEAAAWIDDKGIILHPDNADGASVVNTNTNNRKTEVKTVRLRSLIENETEIDFMKMDIEGAETQVLLDCEEVLGRIKHLYIEFHSFPGFPQELDVILSILKKNNFRYQIHSPFRYKNPFIKRTLHASPHMDLQINIFAYHSES